MSVVLATRSSIDMRLLTAQPAPAPTPKTVTASAAPASTPSSASLSAVRPAPADDTRLMFKAVFQGFARLSASDGEGGSAQAMVKQKIKLELQVEEDGDFTLQFEMRSKVKVRGVEGEEAVQLASGLMQAMQDFTARLLSALRPEGGMLAPAPVPAPTPSPTTALPPAASTPAPSPAPSVPLPAPLPAMPVPAASTGDSATPGTTTPTDDAPPALSLTALKLRVRMQVAYQVTQPADQRLRGLADEIERSRDDRRNQDDSGKTRRMEFASLEARFTQIAAVVAPGRATSLPEFLRALSLDAAASEPLAQALAGGSSARLISARA